MSRDRPPLCIFPAWQASSVPVEDAAAVEVVEAQGQLHEDVPDLLLRHAPTVLPAELVQDALQVPPVGGCGTKHGGGGGSAEAYANTVGAHHVYPRRPTAPKVAHRLQYSITMCRSSSAAASGDGATKESKYRTMKGELMEARMLTSFTASLRSWRAGGGWLVRELSERRLFGTLDPRSSHQSTSHATHPFVELGEGDGLDHVQLLVPPPPRLWFVGDPSDGQASLPLRPEPPQISTHVRTRWTTP